MMDGRLAPKDLSFFDDVMTNVYTECRPATSPFCASLRAVGYYHREKTEDTTNTTLRCVAIKDASFFVENEAKCFVRQKLCSEEELLEKVDLHFPALSNEARRAVMKVTFSSQL